jgi:hypothetical protein
MYLSGARAADANQANGVRMQYGRCWFRSSGSMPTD